MDDILSQGEIDALMSDITECDIHNIKMNADGCPSCVKEREEREKKFQRLLKTIRGFNEEQHWTVKSLSGSIHKLIDESELLEKKE